uniref:peptidylprolyl isomerase n=2 Tax=Gouania willdenowi TaxID=441366 RepID=A0A8C5EQ57_GOUWI
MTSLWMGALVYQLTMKTSVCFLLLAALCCGQEMTLLEHLQVETLVEPEICYPVSGKGDTLKIHYTAKLSNGKVFHSSLSQNPLVVELGKKSVLFGLEQSLMGLCEGQKIQITIPTNLGFGKIDLPSVIPADAAVMFELDVVSLKKKTIWHMMVNDVFPTLCLILVPTLFGLIALYLYKMAYAERPSRKKAKDKNSKNKP